MFPHGIKLPRRTLRSAVFAKKFPPRAMHMQGFLPELKDALVAPVQFALMLCRMLHGCVHML